MTCRQIPQTTYKLTIFISGTQSGVIANNAVVPVQNAVSNLIYTESTLILAIVLSAVLTVLITIGTVAGIRLLKRSKKSKKPKSRMFASMRDNSGLGSSFGSVRSKVFSVGSFDGSSGTGIDNDDDLPTDIDSIAAS